MGASDELRALIPADALVPSPMPAAVLHRLTVGIRTWHHDLANSLVGGISLAELISLRTTDPELARLAERLCEQLEAVQRRSLTMTEGLPRRHERATTTWVGLARGLVGTADAARVRWPAGDLPTTACPAAALRQILRQLVHNALRAEATSVDVDAADRADPVPHWQITVEDDSPTELDAAGVHAAPPEGSARLGMGLVTAASIAAEHGGVVWLRKRPARGTTATILLPSDA